LVCVVGPGGRERIGLALNVAYVTIVCNKKRMRLNDIPTASGGIARAAYVLASQAHISVGPLLRRANLTLQQVKNPHFRMAVRDQIKFLNLVADELQEEFIGIRLGQTADLRELGLLYYVMASSDSLGDALQRGSRYSTIHNEGVHISYRAGKFVTVTLNYFGVARQSDRHQIECIITLLLRMCQELSGRLLVPLRVKLMHHRTRMPSEFRRLFGERVAFACAADEVVYPGSIAHTPSIKADPHLNELLVKYCEEAHANRRKKSATWQLKVENAIVPLLPHGQARIGKIAAELGVSRRTLARRLASEGFTFRKALYSLRFDLAKRYLREEDLPISEIAWLLGYRETSALNHAFKRWTGKAPKRGVPARSEPDNKGPQSTQTEVPSAV
jgi:AraC-like DNA-binding protein